MRFWKSEFWDKMWIFDPVWSVRGDGSRETRTWASRRKIIVGLLLFNAKGQKKPWTFCNGDVANWCKLQKKYRMSQQVLDIKLKFSNVNKISENPTVVENRPKSRNQNCERSELRLHFEWTKVHQKCQKCCILTSFWNIWNLGDFQTLCFRYSFSQLWPETQENN